MFESWTRRSSVGAVFVALLASATLVLADEKIIPTEQYNTEKARALAKTYEGHLRHLSDTIPHCYPWVASLGCSLIPRSKDLPLCSRGRSRSPHSLQAPSPLARRWRSSWRRRRSKSC